MSMRTGASTLAGSVDALALFIFVVAALFAALVAFLIVYFSIKYHYQSTVDRSRPVPSSLPLQIAWIGGALGVISILYVWGARLFIRLNEAPANAIPMYVVGKEWMWKMQHAEGRWEINELHVPVGYPIRLTLTSQDVLHSFYVPAFRIRQEVVPGRFTTVWFQVTEPGEYHLFCGQYCGTDHAAMRGKIIAMTPLDYERWLGGPAAAAAPAAATAASPSGATAATKGALPAGQASASALNPAQVAAGAALFKDFKCGDCHKPDGTGKGPSLQGVFGSKVALEGGKTAVADEAYLRESVLQPNAKVVKGFKPEMPAFQGQIEPEELNQLVVYLESLKGSK